MDHKKKLTDVLADNLAHLMREDVSLDTVDKVAKRSGVGRGTVDRVKKAEVATSLDTVEKLAGAFGRDPVDLLSPQLESPSSRELARRGDEIELRQYSEIGGGMGGGVLLRDQPGEIHSWRVNQEWVTKNIKVHTGVGNLCIVTGFGDSMKPLYNPGDPLVVDLGVKVVEYDAVYFFRVGNEGFIKRLQRIPGEGIRVLSENKRYETWTIKPEMEFEVFGQVLKAWASTDF